MSSFDIVRIKGGTIERDEDGSRYTTLLRSLLGDTSIIFFFFAHIGGFTIIIPT